ncbi:2-hydroxyacid dehydrogenase [Rhodococcus sp. BP-332]|uniref:2-hydroxyacid dehydrogenase n=1 Tax=Rhodococcus sp. BP-332 TaxID=2739447 RepID=UPI001C9B8AAC|nr:2-hydroxyacid dehydrogenase [Rhodococcus sp. BP-332]MBY6676678.1 2-hydroxyacid dehydrogenase [Rhodococcus sp. BP-332]
MTDGGTPSSNGSASSPDEAQRFSRVLRVGGLKPSLMETLEAGGALVLPDDDRDEVLGRHADEIVAVVTSGRVGVKADLMDRLPALRAIVHFGVGYDGTDAEEARRRGIGVSNTPDVLTDAVADTALGLLIDTLRGLSAADRYVRAGEWTTKPMPPLARQVSGSRVGILGLGRIGGAIAHRLEAFGCTIDYHNRNVVESSPYRYHSSPRELAAAVDVLVVAAAGGPETQQLVDRETLDALGPDGFLINVARGSVVDEDALVEALQSGRLAGAGLDVFAHEPEVPDALRALDTVVLLPHVGSATVQTRAAMEALTLENLNSFLADGTLVTPVFQPDQKETR